MRRVVPGVIGLGLVCACSPPKITAFDAGEDETTTGDGDGDGDPDPDKGDGDPDPDPDEGDGDPGSDDGDGDPAVNDISGTYLLALATTVGPDLPLQWIMSVTVTGPGGGSVFADFRLQPLSLDQGQRLVPREFVDAPLVYTDVIVNADGSFVLDMGEFDASGATNPITSSDLSLELALTTDIVEPGAMCGAADGQLLAPIEIPLTGSSFAAIAIDDPSPQALPEEFPWSCLQLP